MTVPEGTDLFASNACHIDGTPEGGIFEFSAACGEPENEAISLAVSAPLHERALFLSLSRADGRFGIGLSFPHSVSPMRWSRREEAGVTVWTDERGIALASVIPFDLAEISPFAVSCLPSAPLAQPCSLGPFPLYCAFPDSSPEARRDPGTAAAAGALRLASTDAISGHRERVSAFLAECAFSTGDSILDAAVAWSRFSAWTLLTPASVASLPLRDRLLSVLTFFLPAGRFPEARSVITDLAALLEDNPESPAFGLFRGVNQGADDVCLFARAVGDYLDRSGDDTILADAGPAVFLALDAALAARCDAHGFLVHGALETRMEGERVSRGDRAVEVEALWHDALRIGSAHAARLGDEMRAARYAERAALVRESFHRFFWDETDHVLADHLAPGVRGEGLPEYRVRPNQLFALLSSGLIDDPAVVRSIFRSVRRELASPFGLYTLCPDDPRFHPRLVEDGLYDARSALDNGPIDTRLTATYLAALSMSATFGTSVTPNATDSLSTEDYAIRDALLENTALILIASPFSGSLPRVIDAAPDAAALPSMRGDVPDPIATAGLAAVAFGGVIGFRPRLSERALCLAPALPASLDRAEASLPFGPGWRLEIAISRLSGHGSSAAHRYRAELRWRGAGENEEPLSVNGTTLYPGKPLTLTVDGPPSRRAGEPANETTGETGEGAGRENLARREILAPRDLGDRYRREPFPARDLAPPWCGASRLPDYLSELEKRHRPGSLAGEDAFTAELEWFFDSDRFFRRYHASVPLGAQWDRERTAFRVWAPTAREVTLLLYESGGPGGAPFASVPMRRLPDGTVSGGAWETEFYGDMHGVYYTYAVRVHGVTRETADPFARACGLNGKRSMVADFSRTDPEGWDRAESPRVDSPNDVVAYELHVADLTAAPSWNGDADLRRTFLGASRAGTACRGVPTGFDHLKSLGITHVQLLPAFDFSSVDESRLRDGEYRARLANGLFNWGYDPLNHSCPEGSYSTDPSDGTTRIRELKTLVRDLAGEGIGVVMDVVYNHAPAARRHPLGITVPGYYFRLERFSGAGDDTASERPMFRAWMVESLAWWLSEYRLSGFRFDLMGLHDVGTMKAVADRLRAIKGDVLLYGEGWDMYRPARPGRAMVGATMLEARKLPGFGFLNDAFRCAIKGSAFAAGEAGFVHDGSRREALKFGLVGATYHHQVHNRDVVGTANPNPWTETTASSVAYTEIHDNMTLHDKLVSVEPGMSDAHYASLHRIAVSLVILAQGMPILHAGMEFMRTKEIPRDLLVDRDGKPIPLPADVYIVPGGSEPGARRVFSHNSYNLSDRVNALDWERCAERRDHVDFVRGLIALRRAHPVFRLRTAGEVSRSLTFLDEVNDGVFGRKRTFIAWRIDGSGSADPWRSALVACNVDSAPVAFVLPRLKDGGSWRLACDGERVLLDRAYGAPICADGITSPLGETHGLVDSPAFPGGTEVSIAGKALYVYAEF